MDARSLFRALAVLLIVVSYCLAPASSREVSSLCRRCNSPPKGSILVEKCNNTKRLEGCCCVDEKNNTVGMDMTHCNLSDVTGFQFTELHQLSILLLDHNPLEDSPEQEQFKGLKVLNYMSLPVGFECPGGPKSWKNQSNQMNLTLCKDQANNCVNVTCPTQSSECLPNGPGFSKCVCKEDWRGYNCLIKEGKFPLVIVLSSLAASAVLTGIIICCINKKGRKNADHFRYQSWYPDEQEDLIHT